ncbi:MAG: sigma 54-interacting transcriptional regulator [Terriglobales bacterium]
MATKVNSLTANLTKQAALLVVTKRPSGLPELWSLVRSNAWRCETVETAWDALERVQQALTHSHTNNDAIDVVLLDAADNADTLHTLSFLRQVRSDLAVLLLADSSDRWTNAKAVRLGARGCLTHPLRTPELRDAILQCLGGAGHKSLSIQPMSIQEPVPAPEPIGEAIERFGEGAFFVCATPAMQKLRVHAESLAQVDAPVLIVGEPGSGKESTARLIHRLSIRSGFPFLKVDCSAFPGDMLEAELFGVERRNPGKLVLADKGVIYLDNISAMPLTLQARLLQVMQEKGFSAPYARTNDARRGGVQIDARIIAAIGPDAEMAIGEGRLRRDLYYRLSAFSLQVPSLRECRNGIPLLLGYFISHLAKQYGLPGRTLSPTLMQACQAHPWRGNVTELRDFAKRYLVVGDEELALWELKKHAGHRNGGAEANAGRNAEGGHAEGSKHSAQSDGLKSLVRDIKGETERNAIANALEETHWNRKAAARLLRISYRTLLYKIQSYGLTPPTLPMLLRQGAKREGRVE